MVGFARERERRRQVAVVELDRERDDDEIAAVMRDGRMRSLPREQRDESGAGTCRKR